MWFAQGCSRRRVVAQRKTYWLRPWIRRRRRRNARQGDRSVSCACASAAAWQSTRECQSLKEWRARERSNLRPPGSQADHGILVASPNQTLCSTCHLRLRSSKTSPRDMQYCDKPQLKPRPRWPLLTRQQTRNARRRKRAVLVLAVEVPTSQADICSLERRFFTGAGGIMNPRKRTILAGTVPLVFVALIHTNAWANPARGART